MNSTPTFLPGVDVDAVLASLSKAAGKELESGKFSSPESSSALAVNAFGWFVCRPRLLPQLPGAPTLNDVEHVEVEYCARFPWAGGRHPWLDAMIETPSLIVGIESKRFEPFRDKKRAILSDAYNRPVWGSEMEPFERMRDTLRADPCRFEFLDAAQLVKHAFGLVTDSARKSKHAHLHYLFAEPQARAGKTIPVSDFAQHRREIEVFAEEVQGAAVSFSACSYREWLLNWTGKDVEAHAHELTRAFAP
jgi:hypothetical protein